jgi:hypothetical protein
VLLWSAVAAGVSGALAVLLAMATVRDRGERRTAFTLVTVAAFILLNGAARTWVLPEICAWQGRSVVRAFLSENRGLALLVRDHPEIGTELETMVGELMREGASADEARAAGVTWGRTHLAPYLGRYGARASDPALSDYLSGLVEILQVVEQSGKTACYGLLFGDSAEAERIVGIDPSREEKLARAMSAMVESAVDTPVPAPAPAEQRALMADLVHRLVARHGESIAASLALVANPTAPGVDRERVCFATTEFYREILRSPEPERGKLLRSLFSSDAEA